MDTFTLIVGFAAIVIVGFALVAVCGLAGAHIMERKGRSERTGAALGVLLGVLGLLLALAIPAKARRQAVVALEQDLPTPLPIVPARDHKDEPTPLPARIERVPLTASRQATA